jgi:hypothetical protein
MPPHIHEALSTALLESRSIPAIERVLSQSLAESGWTTELRAYIQRLVRSGECTNYQQIVKRVMGAVVAEGEGGEEGKGRKGEREREELRVPEKVVKDGVRVVRGELEKVVTVVVDD